MLLWSCSALRLDSRPTPHALLLVCRRHMPIFVLHSVELQRKRFVRHTLYCRGFPQVPPVTWLCQSSTSVSLFRTSMWIGRAFDKLNPYLQFRAIYMTV